MFEQFLPKRRARAAAPRPVPHGIYRPYIAREFEELSSSKQGDFMTISTTRRTLLAGAAAAAATPFAARAQGANDLKGTTVVFASWGGAYQDAEKASYCEPFEKATGAKVVQDGPMNPAKFRAMAASGAPDWDVGDVTGGFLEVGIKDGLFEKIDTKLVNTGRIDPRFVSEYGVGCIVWSSNLGYSSTTAFPTEREAKTWGRPVRPSRSSPASARCRWISLHRVARGGAAGHNDRVAPDKLYPARRRPRLQEARPDQEPDRVLGTNLAEPAALRRP